ncbi:LLM class flavin-dependent oxidoreductase [Salinispora pacifica]|uniref:LLM class flavin-dependent oxidoreductase n=1 Tax=Salinispora pacifica TaxID=351187 RepID=UPI00038143EC|nr:LLM class flavin-dependent oxidoreductase [Salinispora pacifica]
MTGVARALMIASHQDELRQLPARIRLAERLGVDEIWTDQLPDQRDATVVAASLLSATRRARVGTAILPIRLRHPVAMAQAAGTLAELSGGRFILGIGAGHRILTEFVLGERDLSPVGAVRDYLTIVRGLLDKGTVVHEGRYFTARAEYRPPRLTVPVYLAALGPQMIRLAAAYADGIVVYLCTPDIVRSTLVPLLRNACAAVGRDPDEVPIMAVVPAYSGPETADRLARLQVSINGYRLLPAYRKVLEHIDGSGTGRDLAERIALVGSVEQVRQGLDRYRAAGCVPVPSPMAGTDEDFARTVEALYGR